jgi:tRNA nucleotidyltransferase (CCA-adding enzyme)
MNLLRCQLISRLKSIFPAQFHDRLFLVGGSVRDLLTGRSGADLDLAAALTAVEFGDCGFHLVSGRSTAPIWFRHIPELGSIEISPLSSASDLTGDLSRRDFTINAIALDMTGTIIDPLNGRSDLTQCQLRPCTPESFTNDPLRIFRALRFEADGWRLTANAEALIRGHAWDEHLRKTPIERFSREMIKALSARQPDIFFRRMLEFQVGKGFLPEIFRMPGIPAGPLIHHPEGDLFTHSCQVLQRLAGKTDDPLARFCAFFHDLGKLSTDPARYPKHHGHDQAGFEPARSFCDGLRLPVGYRTALAWTSRLHSTLNLWNELRDGTRIKTAERALKAGLAEILPLVAAADKEGGGEPSGWREALIISALSNGELGIESATMESLPVNKRSGFIFQKKVEQFRNRYLTYARDSSGCPQKPIMKNVERSHE